MNKFGDRKAKFAFLDIRNWECSCCYIDHFIRCIVFASSMKDEA